MTPRTLKSPPIAECVVEIRFQSLGLDGLSRIREFLGKNGPSKASLQDVREFQHQQKLGPQGELLSSSTNSALIGYESWNTSHSFRVQATSVSLNFAWIGTYPGGDEVLRVVAVRWADFVQEVKPVHVVRLAIRTINRLSRPWPSVDAACSDFRTWAPLLGAGTPQAPLLHFHRLSYVDSVPVQVQLGQILEEPREGTPFSVVLDVDAWTEGSWPANQLPLETLFQGVRDRKNHAFFASFIEGADVWLQ